MTNTPDWTTVQSADVQQKYVWQGPKFDTSSCLQQIIAIENFTTNLLYFG